MAGKAMTLVHDMQVLREPEALVRSSCVSADCYVCGRGLEDGCSIMARTLRNGTSILLCDDHYE